MVVQRGEAESGGAQCAEAHGEAVAMAGPTRIRRAHRFALKRARQWAFIFYFFKQFTEAGKATASVNPALMVTFDWRRLQCLPPLIKNVRLH